MNVYENLAKNYEHSLRKGTCNFLNNDIKEVQNYIKNQYNIPVVSNIYLLIYKIIFSINCLFYYFKINIYIYLNNYIFR